MSIVNHFGCSKVNDVNPPFGSPPRALAIPFAGEPAWSIFTLMEFGVWWCARGVYGPVPDLLIRH